MKIKSYFFHFAFWGLLFLPYIGKTQFRVDQILGALALLYIAFRITAAPIRGVGRPVATLTLWGALILIWAIILSFVTPGDTVNAFKYSNTFSYFAEGFAIFLAFREKLEEEHDQFYDVMLLYSLLVNALALYMFFHNTSKLSHFILDHYGGPKGTGYGAFGNLAEVSLAGGRISSLFSHSHALAVYEMLVYVVAFPMLSSPNLWRRMLAYSSVMGCVIGGLLTSSKTFFLAFALLLLLQLLTSVGRFLMRPRVSWPIVLSVVSFTGAIAGIYQYSRFVRRYVELFTEGNIFKVFETRFGKGGHLTATGTIDTMLMPKNLIFGMGRGVAKYAWSDNGYIQAMTFGGIFFFLFFYGFIAYLIYMFAKHREEECPRLFAIFLVALVCGNMGSFIFIFPRTALMTTVVMAVVLAVAERNQRLQSSPSPGTHG